MALGSCTCSMPARHCSQARIWGWVSGKRGIVRPDGFAGLAPLHVLALDRHFLDDLPILEHLAHGEAQHLAHPQTHLQRHFEVAAIAQRITTAEALPDQVNLMRRCNPACRPWLMPPRVTGYRDQLLPMTARVMMRVRRAWGFSFTEGSPVRSHRGAVAAAPRPFLLFNPGTRRAEAWHPGYPSESATACQL